MKIIKWQFYNVGHTPVLVAILPLATSWKCQQNQEVASGNVVATTTGNSIQEDTVKNGMLCLQVEMLKWQTSHFNYFQNAWIKIDFYLPKWKFKIIHKIYCCK